MKPKSNIDSATKQCKSNYQPLFHWKSSFQRGSTVTLKYWKGYQIAVVKDKEGIPVYFYGTNIKKIGAKKNGKRK